MTTLLVSEIFPPKIGGSGRWFWELYSRLPRQEYAVAAGSDPAQGRRRSNDRPGDRSHSAQLPHALRPPEQSRRLLARGRGFWGRRSATGRLHWLHAARLSTRGPARGCSRPAARDSVRLLRTREEVNLSNDEVRPPWHRRRVYESRELGWIVGLVLSSASYVIANSDNTASILTERWGLPAERVHRVHPGVDTDALRRALERPRWRAAWLGRAAGADDCRPATEAQGARHPDRGAAAHSRELPRGSLCDRRDGEERGALEGRVSELGLEAAVLFMGEVGDDDLVDCYRQCDLFVLPNREIAGDIEGFGLVLLEAQACGRPVVTGDSGGTRETMDPDRTGVLVACDRPEKLAARLTELLAHPDRLDQMGATARSWVEQRFGWDASAQNAAEVFARWA